MIFSAMVESRRSPLDLKLRESHVSFRCSPLTISGSSAVLSNIFLLLRFYVLANLLSFDTDIEGLARMGTTF